MENYTNTNSFLVELTLSGTGVAGTDFRFVSASQGDIFINDDAGNMLNSDFQFFSFDNAISLSDFAVNPFTNNLVEVSGTRAVLATVEVAVNKDVGDLEIAIDSAFSEVLASDFSLIPNFAIDPNPMVVQGPGGGGVVPEPASMMVWIGMLMSTVFAGWRKRNRHAQAALA
jgi:hypothetical protein